MYGSLDVSTSALTAHRANLDVIAGNVAMKDSMRLDDNGRPTPYRRRVALFAPAKPSAAGSAGGRGRSGGVRIDAIVEDPTPFSLRWDPHDRFAHTDGELKGYVQLSNVDYTTEMVNAMASQRASEANVTVIEMVKSMTSSTLRLIA